MSKELSVSLIACILPIVCSTGLSAQDKTWTIDDCIKYALEKNIQVQKAKVSNDINQINLSMPNLPGILH